MEGNKTLSKLVKLVIWCPSCETRFSVLCHGNDEIYGCPHCMALMGIRDGQPILDEDLDD